MPTETIGSSSTPRANYPGLRQGEDYNREEGGVLPPPRLEATVRRVIDRVKVGEAPYQESWTRNGNRILRVIIVRVRNNAGKAVGSVEIVIDPTEVVNKAEEIKRKAVML